MSASGYIPDEKVDEVRLAADIVDVVGKRVRLTKKGKDWWGLCPFHGDQDPSFKVDRGRATWHCFGCGEGGSVFTFVMKDENLTFPEAVRELAGRYGVELPRPKLSPEQRAREDKRQRLLRVLELAGKFFSERLASSQGAPARRYLEQERGLAAEVARDFGLGWAPDAWEDLGRFLAGRKVPEELAVESGLLVPRDKARGSYDRFRGRVMFPIRDAGGRVVSFGGRLMAQGEPKYLNGPESKVFSKSRTLYNLDRARPEMRRKDRALVVEGYFDVITLAAAGFGETVAPLGTALTEQQVRRLRGQASEAVLVFDGDAAGRRAAARSLPVFLAQGLPARALLLPAGEDPDSFVRGQGPEALERAVDQARPLTEMVLDDLVAAGDLATPEGKSRVVAEAAGVIKSIKDHVTAWLYLERLAGALQLPAGVAARQMGLPLPGRGGRPAGPAPAAGGSARPGAGSPAAGDERCLLELALISPAAARELAESGCLDELGDPEFSRLGEAIKAVLARGGRPSEAAVMDELGDAGACALVGSLCDSAPRLDEAKALDQARRLRALLEQRSIQRQCRELTRAIASAQRAGDTERLDALIAERRAKQDKLKTLHPPTK